MVNTMAQWWRGPVLPQIIARRARRPVRPRDRNKRHCTTQCSWPFMAPVTVSSSGKASYAALTYLMLFALAVAIPLIVVLGALLYYSAAQERAQLEQRVL